MDEPTIVAIIPLYNGVEWIEQSVRSVLSQTRLPDEFIVVDDGSTDDGPAIVERLATAYPLIQLIRKSNGGQSSARNLGVKHSTSSLIALLDQDDAWYPQHLEKLIEPWRKTFTPPLGWVSSDLSREDGQCRMVSYSFLSGLHKSHAKTTLVECLSADMFVLPSASLISREAFDRIGGFDERLCGYEDDDLFLRLFRAGYGNVFIPQPLSKWRIRPDSTSYTARMAVSRMIYADKLFGDYPDDVRTNEYYTRDLIAPRFLRTLLVTFFHACKRRDATQHRQVVADIAAIFQRCRPSLRLKIRLALPFMRSYLFSTMFFHSPVFWPVRRMMVRNIL